MNSMKTAMKLIKIARMVIAYDNFEKYGTPKLDTNSSMTYGPFYINKFIYSNKNGDRYTLRVGGPYKDMIKIKESLKRFGFKYDGENKNWYRYCGFGDIDVSNVKKIMESYVNEYEKSNKEIEYNVGDEFNDKTLTIVYIGDEYDKDFVQNFSNYSILRSTTVKRKMIFKDEDENTWISYVTNNKRGHTCNPTLWNSTGKGFRDDIMSLVRHKIVVSGEIKNIKKERNGSRIIFRMK